MITAYNTVTTIYVNANIVYGECLHKLSTASWKRTIRTGTLDELLKHQYKITTSLLTKMEIVQRLVREENCSVERARTVFSETITQFRIVLIAGLNRKNLLTNTFLDTIMSSNLDFKDALHLAIASKEGLTVVTHDKKFRHNFSQHKDKMKFYSSVVKPSELFNN